MSQYPIGVDILERKKVGGFYRAHRGRLSDLLHPGELAFVAGSRRPAEAFAQVFSAKEAVFKALGASWMGVSGFRDIQLYPKKKFSFRLKGALKKNHPRKVSLRISFKRTRWHIIASCHPSSVTPCVGT